MNATARLFWVLVVFNLVLAAIYSLWHWIDTGTIEWVGTLGLALVAVLSALIGFYVGRVLKSQPATLAEDRLDANIDDGDAEQGFFSPWSWWPVLLAGGAALVFLGLAVGIWIAIIGGVLGLVFLVGFTYEYHRGYFGH